MVNVSLLKAKLTERNLNIAALAEVIIIDGKPAAVTTVYRKLDDNGKRMTIRDATAIGEFLHLSAEEMSAIFFAPFVASDATE